MGYMMSGEIDISATQLRTTILLYLNYHYTYKYMMEQSLKKCLAGSYCVCHNIQYEEIAALVKNMKIRDLEHLQKNIHCGKMCQKCHPDIQKIINHFFS